MNFQLKFSNETMNKQHFEPNGNTFETICRHHGQSLETNNIWSTELTWNCLTNTDFVSLLFGFSLIYIKVFL